MYNCAAKMTNNNNCSATLCLLGLNSCKYLDAAYGIGKKALVVISSDTFGMYCLSAAVVPVVGFRG